MDTRHMAALCLLLLASTAGADVTGSFDGTLSPKRSDESIAAAAAFTEGLELTGTVALPRELAEFGGEYLVTGKATAKRLKVSGTGTSGATLRYRAKINGETLRGKLRVKGTGGKLVGTLALTRNAPLGDGAGCDAVYQANTAFFTDQVLGQALSNCDTCHQPGLQAEAARLRVVPSEPLATARSIAPFVDAANPPASRILQKPLAVLPHGGGPQITPGSTAEQTLRQWVDLVAAANCS
jgi:hypothetical protein